jgi:hypothetical protein
MSVTDPGRNPPRYRRDPPNHVGWVIAAIALVILIMTIAYSMTDRI